MRLTKIYTKIGDKGTTLLASGDRIEKSHLRIEAYGTVDELNSFCGLIADKTLGCKEANFDQISQDLFLIQNELFDIGGELATPLDKLNLERQKVISTPEINRLETQIDAHNQHLEPLTNFVLPGGHELNSLAHVARTICRRAERCVVRLAQIEPVRPEVIVYLNRLSDWFFVVSRVISKQLNAEETLWLQHQDRTL